jgi:cytochrome c553
MPRTILPAAVVAAGALLAALAAGTATGADATAGRAKASGVCAVCHGLNGIAKNPEAPNLAGDNAAYIAKQLHAFQSGARKQEQMSIIAQSLSEQDIADVAAWYSSLKVTVELPK